MPKIRISARTTPVATAVVAIFISMTAFVAKPQEKLSYISTAYEPFFNSPEKEQIGVLEVATELKKVQVKGGWVQVQVEGWVPRTAVEVLPPEVNPSDGSSQENGYIIAAYRGPLLKIPGKTWTNTGTLNAETAIERVEMEGDWIRVRATGWIRSESIMDDLRGIWNRALELYQNHCDSCHHIQPSQFTAQEWSGLMRVMVPQTSLTKKESAIILKWLQMSAENP